MSSFGKKSLGTPRVCLLTDSDDEVVFLGEETLGTPSIRVQPLPPRSNSAGDPIVISSEEEDERMSLHLPARPHPYYSPPRSHHFRCPEQSSPRHRKHHHRRHSHRSRSPSHHSRGEPEHRYRQHSRPHSRSPHSRTPSGPHSSSHSKTHSRPHSSSHSRSPHSRTHSGPHSRSPHSGPHSRSHSSSHSRSHGKIYRDPIITSPSGQNGSLDKYIRRISPHRHNGYVKRSPSREYANSSHCLFSPSHFSHTGSPTRLTRNELRSSSMTSPLSTRTKQKRPSTGYRNGETRPQYICSDPDNKFISPAKRQKLFSYGGSSRPRSLSKHQKHLPYSNGHSHQQTGVSMNAFGTEATRSEVLPGHIGDKTAVWGPQPRVSAKVPIKTEESELKFPFIVKDECSTSPPSQSLGLALKTSPISRSPSPHLSPSKRLSPLSLKKSRGTLNSDRHMLLYEPLSPSPPDGENVNIRRRSRGPAREQDSMSDISPNKNSCRRLSVGRPYQPQTPSKQTKLERFLNRDVTPPIKRDAQSPAIRDVTPEGRDISPAIQDVTPMAQDISPAVREVSQARNIIQDISPTTEDITPALCDVKLAIHNVHPPIQDIGPAVSPTTQGVPTRETFSLPCWSDSELDMMGEACTLPLIEPEVSGAQVTSGGQAAPASVSYWNWVEVYMAGDGAKFVEALEEISSRRCYIPDIHVDAVLRCILRITDCNLLVRVHSVLAADVSYRSNSALSAKKLWELMEDCSRTLFQVCTPVSPSSHPRPYPHSAHVVMLHLMSLLAKDVTTHKDNLSAASVQCILSPVSQWRHVMVILDLLQQLLLNSSPSPPPLPDLLPGLAGLLCMSVSTSREHDYEEGANRLARELSSRMSRLPSVHLKLNFLLLFPCYLLREKTVSIHLTTEFVSSQTPHLPPEHVTLELISTSHFCHCPYRRGQSSPDLLLFLSLLYHLLHSHCSKLLGLSFLHPNSTSWDTPPSKLAHQLESIASQIRRLPQRLAEDDAILPELTSPSCWFYLQLLERIFNWETLLQFT